MCPHRPAEVGGGGAAVATRAYEFLSALARISVGDAIDQSAANVPEFDLTECFETLISANVTVGLKWDDSCTLSTT